MSDLNHNRDPQSSLPGITVFGCVLTGIAGLIGAIYTFSELDDGVGAGICLVASAIGFGLAANAMFRK